MIVILVILSLLGLGAALVVPGFFDLVLVAGPCLVASLWLLWRAHGSSGRWRSRFDVPRHDRRGQISRKRRPAPAQKPHVRAGRSEKSAQRPKDYVIIDGSNVMHWQGGVPQLASVRAVVDHLKQRGFTVGVMFDANAGYKVAGRYQDDRELALALSLDEDKVLVMPKGTVADQVIWLAAQRLGARVVSDDRYRDWVDRFPEIAKPGRLVRGGIREGQVWLTGLDVPLEGTPLEGPPP